MQTAKRQEYTEKFYQWKSVCEAFKSHYSKEEFESWFSNCRFERITGYTAIINVYNGADTNRI